MDCVETMDKKELTKRLSFVAMSDGCLTMHKGCINASFCMAMSARNADFIDYTASLLDAVGVGYKVVPYRDKNNGKEYVRIQSKTHPFLTTLHSRIYIDGRKVLDPHAFKMLDWEAFSLLYMSDGSCAPNVCGGHDVTLNMCRLSYQEQEWLKKQIKDKLGVEFNVYRCGKYYRLGLLRSSQPRFFEMIRPHLLDSFLYKCPHGKPN